MFARSLLFAVALSFVACVHAKTTGDGQATPAPAADAPTVHAAHGVGGSGAASMPQKGHEGAAQATHGHPPLATSPLELRKVGGTQKMAHALAQNGYLPGTDAQVSEADLSAALRRFQEHEHLAATGFADNDTLRKLGLDPEAVDKSLAPRSDPHAVAAPTSPP